MAPRQPRGGDPRAIFALFAALSIVWTWPLAVRISSRIAFDPGDPFLNAWILWWNSRAVPFTSAWWNPPIFYPMPGALALSEHLAGIGVFTTPLFWAGATPAFAYNVALLLSYTLSGFFAYLLVRRLTGSTGAALCAGLAYAFAPFRAGQLPHLQVLTSQWLPVQLLGLHGYIETSRRRWLVLFAAGWVLQSLSNGYYLLFAPVLIVLWIGWFVVAARRWQQLARIALAWALASIALVPVIIQYREVHAALGLTRGRTEIAQFNATLESFLKAPDMLAFWPPGNARGEDLLFPGVTMVTVIGVALVLVLVARVRQQVARPVHPLVFYVLAAVFMAALTLGPAWPDEGPVRWLRPYEWLIHLPGYNNVRVPVRFAMLMALCLAIGGGLALDLILPAARTRRLLVSALVALGIGIDGWMDPMPVSPPPGQIEVPDVPAATVLELPPDVTSVSVGAMLRAMRHGRPLVNGYSGHIPPHYAILSHALRRDDPSAVVELARGRTLLIIVSQRADPAGDFRRVIESIPDVEHGGLSSAGSWYVLRAQPRERRPRSGTPLGFTITKEPRAHVVLDLGTPRAVRTLEFALRDRWFDFGRRFAIQTSDDGRGWQTVWEDWTGGAALAGALEDQLEVPVRLVLPDVTTRYLRIHPVEDWLLATLKVLGP